MAPGPDVSEATRTAPVVPRRRTAVSSVEAAVVLLERRVDGERGGDHHAGQRLRQPEVHQDDVAVGRREQRPGQPLPLLRDAGDLDAGRVGDREVPGPPVLGLDRPDELARSRPGRSGSCRTRWPGRSRRAGRRPAAAPRTRDFTNLAGRVSTSTGPRRVADLERVGQELVEVGDEAGPPSSAPLCPTWTTAPICCPWPSKTAYSLVSSISLVFWFTTQDRLLVQRRAVAVARHGAAAGGGGAAAGAAVRPAGGARSSPGRPTSGCSRLRRDRGTSRAAEGAASRRSS